MPSNEPHAPPREPGSASVAFVLGGGGVHGAAEVGMIAAHFEAGTTPELVLGTSIGAMNGAMVAADPARVVERPTPLCDGIADRVGEQ